MINKFDGKYAFLSNFYESPISDGEITYPTVEHYFQAMKTSSMEEAVEIAAAPTPGRAKRLGRKCQLRPEWEEIKMTVMNIALHKKFADPVLRAKLLATGDEYLEEGNYWHDNFWGVCYCEKCQDEIGHNNLGKLLMKLRKELKYFDQSFAELCKSTEEEK